MSLQKTIEKETVIEGAGLFSGHNCRMRFLPASADSGINFVRTDMPAEIKLPADIDHVSKQELRRTTLCNGSVSINTVEHLLAAISALGIDNLTIELNSDEIPSTDASAMPYIDALNSAGTKELDIENKPYVIEEPVCVSNDDATLSALPGPKDKLDIIYDLDYGGIKSIGRQVMSFSLGADDFTTQIAPSRTFLLEDEARQFQAAGLGKHLTLKDLVIMGDEGVIDNELRFADEHVRHKICDLIGDLRLLGRPIFGRIVAYKSGHDLNHQLVKKHSENSKASKKNSSPSDKPLMDIRKIMKLLPHRYPFLMVDRLIEIVDDKRAVGIKNVSINEPFFQGHYPGEPIMPGVLTLEALAQVSGLLLSRRLENTGKVAVLLSMDRVKMRKPVRPGDQLLLEAEALHVRNRTGHCKCRAMVAGEVAAEAEIKFMLIDAEPI